MRFDDLYQQVGPSVEGPMPLLLLTEGWLEASSAMGRLHETLIHTCDLTTIAQFDTDQLFDQRTRRPMLTVIDGVTQAIQWPELELAIGTDADDTPFMLLHGPEPDFAWRPFAKAVANLAGAVGVTTAFSMAAYPAPMPHTRPVRISSTASEAEMLIGRPHTTGSVTVPVGVQVAITEELERFGVPSHGLYAQVPYYLSSHEWPQAPIGILRSFGELAGLNFDDTLLRAQVEEAIAAVDLMISESPGLDEVVTKLENRYDELKKIEEGNLPTGDELEEELQQYLRKIDGE